MFVLSSFIHGACDLLSGAMGSAVLSDGGGGWWPSASQGRAAQFNSRRNMQS